ncbi:unnamed protein product [Adineta steineri]|uniref:Uncharacterized protein n=1 Tax=Adineta steineri TaxID=433720 RepID=A0A820LHW6_9BILA|nr:unnamed protein product [Adineta steineri]
MEFFLRSLSLHNEYISQIRFNNNYLWCLELISSSLSSFIFQSNNSFERKQFISFKQQEPSFNPFRFAVNDLFIAVLDRALTGLILIFDKQTSSIVKQTQSPLIDFQPCDIELTNQTLIYRFHHKILLIQLDNEQYIEQIDANKNINITIGKSNNEILLSSLTDDTNTFIIQSYIT